jgi:hypothetical protein
MQASTFDVADRRKHIIVFKVGSHWIFKHYFDDKAIFRDLAHHYDKDNYRFEFRTIGDRNRALKLLEHRGFDVQLAENLKGYVVKMDRYSKYAAVLKNSVYHVETPEWRVFLMKDLASVEEALRQGAKMVEVDVKF